MTVRDYEKTLKDPLKQATLLLLLKDNKVLLAMKKRGFGVGKWNGVGGKPNPNETILETAIRESQEEIKVTPLNPKKVAIFNYHFPNIDPAKNFGLQVHIYTATKWDGEPIETEEMRPQWFKLNNIPYGEMWSDDEIWMPMVFSRKLVQGSFMFKDGDKINDYYISEVQSLD